MSIITELADKFGMAFGAGAAALFGFQKVRSVWNSDKLSADKSDATAEVIKLLREEVERLSARNEALEVMLEEHRKEVVRLRKRVMQFAGLEEPLKDTDNSPLGRY